jgi:ribosomal protein S18 acetylase RimI-like enzyme
MGTEMTMQLTPVRNEDLPHIAELCRRALADPTTGVGYPRWEDEADISAEYALLGSSLVNNLFFLEFGGVRGLSGFLASDEDTETYIVGPMFDRAVHADVARASVEAVEREAARRFEKIRACVQSENTVLLEALTARSWRCFAQQSEMKLDLAGCMHEPSGFARLLDQGEAPEALLCWIADLLHRTMGWKPGDTPRVREYLDDGYLVTTLSVGDRPAGIGMGCALQGTDFGRVEYLAIEPEFQGRGLGTHLLRDMVARLRREGLKEVFLAVEDERTNARRLYEREGFRATVRSKNFEKALRSA